MRLGICVGIDPSNLEEPINRETLRTIKGFGYHFVELPLAALTRLSLKQLEQVKTILETEDLACESCNILLPGDIRITGTEVIESKIRGYLEDAFSLVRSMGVEIVVFGSGGARNVPEGFDPEEAFNQLVSFLQIVDEYAREAGCTIAIEPLNSLESNIIRTIREGNRLVQAVDRPSIKLLVDYYHFGRERDSYEDLAEASESIVHVHLADVETRSFPTLLDEDYQRFLSVLVDHDYEGRYCIEFLGKPDEKGYTDACSVLHKGLNLAEWARPLS